MRSDRELAKLAGLADLLRFKYRMNYNEVGQCLISKGLVQDMQDYELAMQEVEYLEAA